MYKFYINIILIFILIGIILISVFSLNNINGFSIGMIYIIIILLILIISYFVLKGKMYISILCIIIVVFGICIINSIKLYTSYALPNNFF